MSADGTTGGAVVPTTAPRPPESWTASALGQILVRLGVVDAVEVMLAAYEQDLGDGRRIGEILVARGLATREDIQLALLDQSPDTAPQPAPAPALAPEPAAPSAAAPQATAVPPQPLADAAFPRHQGGLLRAAQSLALLILLGLAAGVLLTTGGGPVFGIAVYGLLSMPYLLAKLVLSSFYRPARGPVPVGTAVSVVVPFFNEDPVTFDHCLAALMSQSMQPLRIYVVDDGSATRACLEVATRYATAYPNVSVHRSPENRGKRFAPAWGFDKAQTAIVVTVDSDTVLQSDAIAEIVKPFADSRVNGVCGYARGLNRRRNLLTRLIDLRYTNSFLYERGASSVLGSVLCSTGVLSAWRRDVVLDNREDYLTQRFLGTEVHYGDDRRLTAYALRTGRVVLQDTAVALTHVPERMSHFLKQQIRWNKSFFRESLLLLRQSRPTRIAWWLGLAEFGYWMVLTTMLLYAVAVRPIVSGVAPSWHFAAFVALMAYARSIRMIGDGGRPFPAAFLLAPVYGLMNLLLLVPLRFYSLLRLRDGSWGTRKRRRGISRREAAALAAAPTGLLDPVVGAVPAGVVATVGAAAPVAGAAAVSPAPVAPRVPAQVRTGRACVNVLAD
ncbi:MAG: hyaluronan synthase [Actinomycetota bacterium]|nr:hyaluronan synthase [Actinomycetota bacterium]